MTRQKLASAKPVSTKSAKMKVAKPKASSTKTLKALNKTTKRGLKPTNAPEEKLTRQIREEIWPGERKTLFNPDRLRYVRKLIKPAGCVFCSAVEAGCTPESLLLYKGEHAIVVLNKYPYNNGHLLILPRRHCGEFLELTENEHRAMNHCLTRALKALQEAYQPSGFNVGLNLGSAAGAGIPEHLHYHVIPRWSGDTNFFPLIADTKVVVETLEQTYRRLLPYFEGASDGN
jgi:ATP adenylyltransferase